MVLLIPRRIKQIKDEGREEGRAEGRAKGREEGFKIGFAEGFVEGFQESRQKSRENGIQTGRAQEREAIDCIIARYDRGEIAMERLHAILSDRCNGYGERG